MGGDYLIEFLLNDLHIFKGGLALYVGRPAYRRTDRTLMAGAWRHHWWRRPGRFEHLFLVVVVE